MKHMQWIKIANFIFFALIIFVALFLRLFQLGNVPYGVTNDNASYIYSAYSVWKTGKGIDGSFLPLSFNTDSSNSPVPIYLDAPFVGILGVSPLAGRLPYALSGVGSGIVLYGIVWLLFRKKSIALFSSFVLSISPWAIFINRTSYEANIAFFFYLLALFIFLKKIKKGNILWSLPFFLLAFYSYHATKIFFIFLVPLLVGIYRQELLQRKKELIIFGLGYIFILLSFFIIVKTQHVTRQEILLTDTPESTRQVNLEREKSSAPSLMQEIFSNKPLYYLRIIRENYLEVLSPQFLFLYGDTGSFGETLGMYSRGEMYIIELPLLLLGLYFLAKRADKKSLYFLLCILFLAPLGSTFTVDKTYPLRDIMLLLPLSTLVGLGLYQLCVFIKMQDKSSAMLLCIGISSLYIFLFSSFLYQYFFRYPIYGGESWQHSNRILDTLVGSQTQKYQHIYIADSEKMFFVSYAIYNKIEPMEVQKAWKEQVPSFGNVTFLNECMHRGNDDPHTFLPHSTLYITPSYCHPQSTTNNEIRDVGEPIRTLWKIYEN